MNIIEGPYHYAKWLTRMARRTPTGARIVPLVEEVLDLISRGALRQPGPEQTHPLTLKLKEIRTTLIESAIAAGINAPWLREWWLHIYSARRGVEGVVW